MIIKHENVKRTTGCNGDDNGLVSEIYEVVFVSIHRKGSASFDLETGICEPDYKERLVAVITYNVNYKEKSKVYKMPILEGETVEIIDQYGKTIEEIKPERDYQPDDIPTPPPAAALRT